MALVKAKNKVTGLIAVVSEESLKRNPNLEKATEADLAEDLRIRQVKIYGHELTAPGLPSEVTGVPDAKWSKAKLIAYAENKKISVDESLTRAELLKALTEGSTAHG